MTWQPIGRVADSTDVRAQGGKAAVLIVDVELTQVPPEEWQEAFGVHAGGETLGDDVLLDGTRVTTWSAPGRIEIAVARIDMRIAIANQIYERSVAPVLAAEARRCAWPLDALSPPGGADASG